MSKIEGKRAYPEFNHILEPMITGSEPHQCHLCKPDRYARLAPGFATCAKCGVVIWTGDVSDPFNEAMELCEGCADELNEEFGA